MTPDKDHFEIALEINRLREEVKKLRSLHTRAELAVYILRSPENRQGILDAAAKAVVDYFEETEPPDVPRVLEKPPKTDAEIESCIAALNLVRKQSTNILKRLAGAGISTFTTPEGTTWSRDSTWPPSTAGSESHGHQTKVDP